MRQGKGQGEGQKEMSHETKNQGQGKEGPWQAGLKIRRALGPMAGKIACGPSSLTLDGPADFQATAFQWWKLVAGFHHCCHHHSVILL